MKKIGFTTTIPVESVFAAGIIPVDLNNVFITSCQSSKLVDEAEKDGFPRNTCAWIKGIYSALKEFDIDAIIGVIEGDCSNTRALLEVLVSNGTKCFPFSYPISRKYDAILSEIKNLSDFFGVSIDDCKNVKREIDIVREKVRYLDELTWKHNKATGFENHIWQVSTSDFNGNYNTYLEDISVKIKEIEERKAIDDRLRLGFIGVPPIMGDLYEFLEIFGARVVFNEVQRQFTMVHGIGMEDLAEVYRMYTYPYDLNGRLEDIKKEIITRNIQGIIHYTQSFCFRAIEDIIIRKELGVPVLTLEGDKPGKLDSRTKLRIEAFVDMIV